MIHVLFFLTTSWLTPGNFIRPQKSSPGCHLKDQTPGGIPPLERARSLVMICLMSAKMSSTFDCNVVDPFVRRGDEMTQEIAHIFLEVVGKKEVLDLRTKGIQLIEIIILQKPGDDENPIREMGEPPWKSPSFPQHLRCALNALQLRGQKVQFVSCGPSLMYVLFVVGKAMFFFVFWRLQLSNCKKTAPCFFFDFVEISAVVFLQV